MADQDKGKEDEPTAKRSNYQYYLDIRSDGKGVGPHTPARINWWLEHRKISPEILARRIDQDQWVKLSEIKRFSNFLEKIAKLPSPQYEKAHWEDDPVTEKQLKRLASFDLPIPETKLTKGEASRLIDFYINVDPEREKKHQDEPIDEEKRNKLRELIKRLPVAERADFPLPVGLTNAEAAELISEIEFRVTEFELEKDEEANELMFIDNHFNDEDIREDFGYKKLTQKHLKLLREYLPTHDPNWSSKSRYDTAGIVLKLFPELKKAEKTHASHERKHAQSTGCILILVPLIGILLYALKETLLHIR
jgi:hypothetical protein